MNANLHIAQINIATARYALDEGDPLCIVNMSVWTSVEALFDFVYKTAHRSVMINRRKWFEKPEGAYQALRWIPAEHTPTVEEGLAR